MSDKSANPSIECTVTSCTHHCNDKQYCSLNAIKVGCQNNNVTNCGSTECASFELGHTGGCCR